MFSSSMLSGPGYDAFICALKDAGAVGYNLGAIGLQSLADVHRGLGSCGLRDEDRMLYRGRLVTGSGGLYGIAWSRAGADILAAVTSSNLLKMVNMSTGVSRSVSLPSGNLNSYKPRGRRLQPEYHIRVRCRQRVSNPRSFFPTRHQRICCGMAPSRRDAGIRSW